MRLWKFIIVVVLAAARSQGEARATPRVQVLETYPAGNNVAVPVNRKFLMRLSYSSDKPFGVWIEPGFQGIRVPAGTSPSRRYEGDGEAVVWFFFNQPGQVVDEVRITAGDGLHNQLVATYRVHVVGDLATDAPDDPPEWVRNYQKEVGAASKGEGGDIGLIPPNPLATVLGWILGFAFFGMSIAGFVLVVRALSRWHGGWRVAAAVPVAGIAFMVLSIVVDTSRDPTSHNLWPLEFVMAGLWSFAFIGLMMVVRWLRGADR